MTGLYARLIAAGVLMLALVGGLLWFGAHERGIGAAKVQAKWDLANAAQTKLALDASESARNFERSQSASFSLISDTYLQATSHAYPSIADALPAAVAAGTVRLRNDCHAIGSGGVPSAATGTRGVDVAAAAAATQRLATAVAAVRVGEQADARERQLSAQVTALQAVLRAERETRGTNP